MVVLIGTWETGHPRWALSAAEPSSVQPHPMIHLVVWGAPHAIVVRYVESALSPAANDYWATLRQYGVAKSPRLIRPIIRIAEPPRSLTQVLAWVRHRAGSHPNRNTQYLVLAGGGAWTGGYVPGMGNASGKHFWDADVAVDVVAGAGVITAIHEIAEAATDPRVGSGWIGPGGQEVADRCETTPGGLIVANNSLAGRTTAFFVPVPSLWNQVGNKCVR